jgi:hypothetical protein
LPDRKNGLTSMKSLLHHQLDGLIPHLFPGHLSPPIKLSFNMIASGASRCAVGQEPHQVRLSILGDRAGGHKTVAALGKTSYPMRGRRNQLHQVRPFTPFNRLLHSGRHAEGDLRLPPGKSAQIGIFVRKPLKTNYIPITVSHTLPDDRLTEQADGLEPERIEAVLDIGPDDLAVSAKALSANPGQFPVEAILLDRGRLGAEDHRPVIGAVQAGIERQIGAMPVIAVDRQGDDQPVRFLKVPVLKLGKKPVNGVIGFVRSQIPPSRRRFE